MIESEMLQKVSCHLIAVQCEYVCVCVFLSLWEKYTGKNMLPEKIFRSERQFY